MSDLRPLSGRPRCAFKPGLECTDDCEYGLVGTCGHERLEPDVPGPIVIDHISPSHGSPELDADAAKLEAMGADPGPTE